MASRAAGSGVSRVGCDRCSRQELFAQDEARRLQCCRGTGQWQARSTKLTKSEEGEGQGKCEGLAYIHDQEGPPRAQHIVSLSWKRLARRGT